MLGVNQHQFFPLNVRGRDFFVGDIHGEKSKLMAQLAQRQFDPDIDRCFALGDLIDRGPDSAGMLRLLDEGWFFSVVGNHELMLLEARDDPSARWSHLINGGQWTTEAGCDADTMAALVRMHCSLAFTVETKFGMLGMVHATAPANWAELQHTRLPDSAWTDLVWDRFHYRSGMLHPEDLAAVRGIDLVLHGHVSCEKLIRVQNRVWMDTLFRGGGLSVLEARDAFVITDAAVP